MARTGETWDEYEGSYVAVPWSEGRDILVRGTSRYLNFGTLVGTSGYGFRDNAGVMQFKNSGGSWSNLGSGGGGGVTEVAATGAVDGMNNVFVFASAVNYIVVDGVWYRETTKNSVVNWTNTGLTYTLNTLIVPSYDIFGVAI